jgi:hypothetical protein
MLAPPAKRRADRTRKRRQLRREKLGLHRCQLWLTDRALEGLIAQLVATGKLTDKAANDHRNIRPQSRRCSKRNVDAGRGDGGSCGACATFEIRFLANRCVTTPPRGLSS